MSNAVRPSPELLAVLDRWQEAMRTRNGKTIRNLLSEDAALRYVGSAAEEVWSGEVLREGFVDHVREIPEFSYDQRLAEAYQCGDCGWGLWTGYLKFDGVEEPSFNRFSFVFALEDGVWRIVQMHCSNPIPNIEKMGIEQHAMEALVRKAREGFRLDQREGVATIMFTDVVGSTALAAELGDARWMTRIDAHMRMVRGIVGEAGGEVVKSLGDGAMSSFTTVGDALRAAAALQAATKADETTPRLALRIGLHCGDVIQTKDDFFGNVVNKAARIAATAGAGEVRVSDEARMEVGGEAGFAFHAPALVALKGFEGEALTHLLRWETQDA